MHMDVGYWEWSERRVQNDYKGSPCLGVRGRPKFANDMKCSSHTMSSNIILGMFKFVTSLNNIIECGRKLLGRVACLEEKN